MTAGLAFAATPLPILGADVPTERALWNAGRTLERIESNINDKRGSDAQALLDEMFEVLPREENAFGTDPADIRGWGKTIFGTPGAPPEAAIDAVAEAAFTRIATARAREPSAFRDLPDSREAFEAELTRRRQAEYDEAQAVVAAAGDLAGWGEFGGRAVEGMTDQWTLGTLMLGAPAGASLRTAIGIEALVGGLGEAAMIPRQMRVAGELDVEPPNVAAQIMTGAAFGGVLGGVAGVLGRAARGSPEVRDGLDGQTAGVDPVDADAALERGRAALDDGLGRDGARPLEAGPEVPSPVVDVLDYDVAGGSAPDVRRAQVPGLDFAAIERREGLPEGFLGRTAQIESGGDPSARNPRSSAGGLFQQIDSNARDYGVADRFDPVQSTDGAVRFALDNQRLLRRVLGREPTGGELYLAHQQGGGGASRLLRDPSASAVSVVGRDAVRLNGGRLDMTAGEFANLWIAKYEGATPAVIRAGGGAGGGGSRRGYTAAGQVTAGETTIDVEYQVVDLDSLRAASGDLQPRDRSRAASAEQIDDMAARLDPARLLPWPEADRGAPVVGPDDMVESGNGRVAAIRRAAELVPDRYDAYRAALTEAGYDVPEGVARPVLIARRRSELDPAGRSAFVRAANASTTARMAPSEQARIDARAMTLETMELYDPEADLSSAANRDFARAALAGIPQTERGALYTDRGALSLAGQMRLQQAMFARAYDAPDILAAQLEVGAGDLRSLTDGLQLAAPAWSRMRAGVAQGRIREEMDVTPWLLQSVRLIAEARRTARRDGKAVGGVLEELLADVDLLAGALPEATIALTRVLMPAGRAATGDRLSAFLRRYAAEADGAAGEAGGLFEQPGALDILKRVEPEAFADVTEMGRAPAGETDFAAAGAFDPGGDPLGFDEGAASRLAQVADDAALARLAPERAVEGEDAPAGGGPEPEGETAPQAPVEAGEDLTDVRALAAELETIEAAEGVDTSARLARDLVRQDDLLGVVDVCPTGRGI